MDKDRVKGSGKDIKGRIKRQVGEWTGNKKMQREGAAEQAEGKAQKTVGEVKDVGRQAVRNLEKKMNKDKAA
jgi:uncharacterized protein YjbJ (UPF0337 family)